MFELRGSDKNPLPVQVMVGGKVKEFTVYYATPKTSRMAALHSARMKWKGGKPVFNAFHPSIQFGLEVLTGVEDGVLTLDGAPISTDPGSPNYRADWKDILRGLVEDNASIAGMLQVVTSVAFDGVKASGVDIDVEEEGEEVGKPSPLASS